MQAQQLFQRLRKPNANSVVNDNQKDIAALYQYIMKLQSDYKQSQHEVQALKDRLEELELRNQNIENSFMGTGKSAMTKKVIQNDQNNSQQMTRTQLMNKQNNLNFQQSQQENQQKLINSMDNNLNLMSQQENLYQNQEKIQQKQQNLQNSAQNVAESPQKATVQHNQVSDSNKNKFFEQINYASPNKKSTIQQVQSKQLTKRQEHKQELVEQQKQKIIEQDSEFQANNMNTEVYYKQQLRDQKSYVDQKKSRIPMIKDVKQLTKSIQQTEDDEGIPVFRAKINAEGTGLKKTQVERVKLM